MEEMRCLKEISRESGILLEESRLVSDVLMRWI